MLEINKKRLQNQKYKDLAKQHEDFWSRRERSLM